MANLLNPDDEVEVVIIKAKPKYPNQIFNNQEFFTKHTANTKNNPVITRSTGLKQPETLLSQAQLSPVKPDHKEIKLAHPPVA